MTRGAVAARSGKGVGGRGGNGMTARHETARRGAAWRGVMWRGAAWRGETAEGNGGDEGDTRGWKGGSRLLRHGLGGQRGRKWAKGSRDTAAATAASTH